MGALHRGVELSMCLGHHVAEAVGIGDQELPRLATRFDSQGHKFSGWYMSGTIICGDSGRPFSHKIWHSGTPNRVDVWECRTNYAKRGTCPTSHFYQNVLLVKMTEALQALAGRNSAVLDMSMNSLRATGVRRSTSTLRNAISMLLTAPLVNLTLHIPDSLAALEGGCMLTEGRPSFEVITGEAVTLDLPHCWSPVMRVGDYATKERY